MLKVSLRSKRTQKKIDKPQNHSIMLDIHANHNHYNHYNNTFQHDSIKRQSLRNKLKINFAIYAFGLLDATATTTTATTTTPSTTARTTTISGHTKGGKLDFEHYQSDGEYPVPKQYYHSGESQIDFENDIVDEEMVRNPLDRGPYFELSATKNITALAGNSAYLNCRVRNLGNRTVSVFCFALT